MNSCHFSESAEHYTPSWIVEKDNGYLQSWVAKTVFLDPPGGRCDRLGRRVLPATGATPACTTSGSCGLPPGHVHEGVDSAQKRWWEKLSAEFVTGHVQHAVFVAFSVELLQVTQVDPPPESRIPLRFPILFPSRRVAYAIVLLTRSWETLVWFEELAWSRGEVVVPQKWEERFYR